MTSWSRTVIRIVFRSMGCVGVAMGAISPAPFFVATEHWPATDDLDREWAALMARERHESAPID